MAEDNNNANVNMENQGSQAFEFDYDKIANILDSRQKANEESVLKGYFKQQGLTGEEMSKAIEMFKADKASKTPDIEALTAQIEEANQRALNAELELKVSTMAAELGVSTAKVPYLLKMADTGRAVKEGKIDKGKLKESLEAVLKDVPELKSQSNDTSTVGGFKIGAGNDNTAGNNRDALNSQLAQAFGVKIK